MGVQFGFWRSRCYTHVDPWTQTTQSRLQWYLAGAQIPRWHHTREQIAVVYEMRRYSWIWRLPSSHET